MPHIFISYAKKDTRPLAITLNKALNALPNITAWVDLSMRVGHSWELQIQSEIDKCDFFVVLYSEDIHRHKHGEPESYVLTEIAYAKRYAHKPIIPIMAQATQPPMSMINEHYIDYFGLALSLEALVESICFEAGIAQPQIPTSLKLLPAPCAWISISAGQVTLEGGHGTFEVPAYDIAQYPMTNAQYALFISDGGYSNAEWWTEAGWDQRQQDKWAEPRYWTDARFNDANQPVVGVSWYEAHAFTRWLSAKTGESIHLPTEQAWQRAAQGDDGRTYPWGNAWDGKRCNNSVEPMASKQTTPVTQYAGQGDSPFGVVDMAGNVWEWTSSAYDTAAVDIESLNLPMLRGGSRLDVFPDFFRASFRFRIDPAFRRSGIGFRVARSQ